MCASDLASLPRFPLSLGGTLTVGHLIIMHTDNRPPIEVNGRPYAYYDARSPKTLTSLIEAAMNNDGLCIIDSGGNRPEFDQWIADSVDLVIIPVTPDPEAVSEGLEHMKRLEEVGKQYPLLHQYVSIWPHRARICLSRIFIKDSD